MLSSWVSRQDRLVQSVLQSVSTALWVRDVSGMALPQGAAGAGDDTASFWAGTTSLALVWGWMGKCQQTGKFPGSSWEKAFSLQELRCNLKKS